MIIALTSPLSGGAGGGGGGGTGGSGGGGSGGGHGSNSYSVTVYAQPTNTSVITNAGTVAITVTH